MEAASVSLCRESWKLLTGCVTVKSEIIEFTYIVDGTQNDLGTDAPLV